MDDINGGEGSYHAIKDVVFIKSEIDTYEISISEFRKRLKKSGGGGYWTSRIIQYSGHVCQVTAA